MKANELMVGDWVMVNDIEHTHPLQVAEIFNKCGAYYATLYWDGMPDNVNPETLTADVDKVLPIPLTQVILEKNGFEYFDSYATLDTEKYRVIYAFDGFLTIVDDDNQRKVSYLECNYVHHLQHTLRLCGIEKEIEL